ncbi:MAG TPA: UvrD-helicase domain-containing protein [Candidatus Coprenecus stercoravium]|uniref:DNA 3'-5' helicase n=1 Tax=Candidatus Coprenecus stercoravium TaxID=2840735 RepID=A0A9D2GS76_9BACT|nr:UvrD-helicase domain-containing protein [Candidatus Coprenecus stercoravium]
MNLSGLNSVQQEAVRCVNGASMIIAGAGSGKTRVLTWKIAAIIESGVEPSSIMALTFTNKAAKEMKERVAAIVGKDKARRLWMGTFHSIFARILREYAELIGFPKAFTIYDASDAKNAVKVCIRELGLDDKVYKPGEVLSRISTAKNYLVTAADYMGNHEAIRKDTQMHKGRICDVYKLYAEKCKAEGVMDFDDILLYTNILLVKHPEVAEHLRSVVSHILVDEYQDTNMAQYRIVNLLARQRRNITVVGDDSQSIYAFRGARIQNILNFKRDYPEASEFRLEQNYRSTQVIVNAANSVIEHNHNRLKKECFSEGDKGEKIELIRAYDDRDEAASVVSSIMRRIYSTKASYDSFSILYRVNSQSRVLEEALRKKNIPYIIYAGHSFYERKEVKDMLAYFRLVLNHNDNEAFRRVVNLPARGIGQTSLTRLSEAAAASGTSLWEMCRSTELGRWDIKESAAAKLRMFADMIDSFKARIWTDDAYTLAVTIAEGSGLLPSLKADLSVEGMSALGNVTELLNGVQEFVATEVENAEQTGESAGIPTLEAYMENVALLTDADKAEDEDENNRVKLMTVHASKGLEFPYVYITGLEENLFPSSMSSTAENVEEERRLFYVALTRAEKAVTLSYAGSRFLNGKTSACRPSRFLKEIDSRYLDGEVEDFSSVGGNDYEDEHVGWSGWRSGQVQRTQTVTVSTRPDTSRFKPVEKTLTSVPGPVVSTVSVGDKVSHDRFGTGEVVSVAGTGGDMKAVVRFDRAGEKTLLLKFARLQKI